MKKIAILLIIGVIYGTSAYASPETKACRFSSNAPDCKEFLLCKGMIKRAGEHVSKTYMLMSQKNFLIVLRNIEEGNECAQSLGFQIFDTSLRNSSAGYMEDTSIALGYSIEKNPVAFLKEIPSHLLEHGDALSVLSCGVHDEYSEDAEYLRRHLRQRLSVLSKVKRPELISRRKTVENAIRHCLTESNNLDTHR